MKGKHNHTMAKLQIKMVYDHYKETGIKMSLSRVNGEHLVNDFSPCALLGWGFFHKALLLSLSKS
jgi:hypothetical protein